MPAFRDFPFERIIMDAALVMKTSCVLLAIAALGGLTMAGLVFAGKAPPAPLAMLHGLLAAAAITLLAFAYFTVGLPALASWALLLFVLAAAGGAFLNLNFHWKALPMPKGIVVAHAGIAVAGFVLLVLAVLAAPRA
jgi:hypothetical protein